MREDFFGIWVGALRFSQGILDVGGGGGNSVRSGLVTSRGFMSKKSLVIRGMRVVICAAAGMPVWARAADVTWVNPAGGNWEEASNWSSFPNLPRSGDDVVIPGSAGAYSVTLSSGTQSIGGLSMAEVVNVNAGTLDVAANVMNIGANFNVNGGTLGVGGNMSNLFITSGVATVNGSISSADMTGGLLANATVGDLNTNGAMSHIAPNPVTFSALTVDTARVLSTSATIVNGVVINDFLFVGPDDPGFGELTFQGSQTISGRGVLTGGGFFVSSGSTVTIAQGSEDQGDLSHSVNGDVGSSLVINGSLRAYFGIDTFGSRPFDHFFINIPFVLSNTGQLTADEISTLHLGTPFNWNTGLVTGIGLVRADDGLTISGSVQKTDIGTLYVAPASSMSGGFSMAAGSKLDLNGGELVVDSSSAAPTSFDAIRALVLAGYNGGGWDGTTGITSTFAQSNPQRFGIAIERAGEFGSPDLVIRYDALADNTGVNLDPGAVLVKFTLNGDTDLSSGVDFIDLANFVNGFEGMSSGWAAGDFNYDGMTDLTDWKMFVQGFVQTSFNRHGESEILAGQDLANLVQNENNLTAAQKQELIAAIPEPGSLGAVGCCGVAAILRRRRR
jgi:hypothetical protein